MKAIWHGTILAESDDVLELEGNRYFPPDSVKREYLRISDSRSVCPWKGPAVYYDVVVGGEIINDGAWCYREPSSQADKLRGRIAFWKDVEFSE